LRRRDRIRERTKEGFTSTSKKGGLPGALETNKAVQACRAKGLPQSQAAAELSVDLPTIKRHRNK
jgi:putative DNA-invertase from lambdoid prophage Rac